MSLKEIGDNIFSLYAGGFTPEQVSKGLEDPRAWQQAHADNAEKTAQKKSSLFGRVADNIFSLFVGGFTPEQVSKGLEDPRAWQQAHVDNAEKTAQKTPSLLEKFANVPITAVLGAPMEDLAKIAQRQPSGKVSKTSSVKI